MPKDYPDGHPFYERLRMDDVEFDELLDEDEPDLIDDYIEELLEEESEEESLYE